MSRSRQARAWPVQGSDKPGDFEHDVARRAVLGQVDVLDLPPDHQMRDLARVRRRPIERLDVPPVAQHGDPIGAAKDFVQLVRDVEDRDAPRQQPVDNAEQPLDFRFGERARRLVHDEDRRVLREGLGDFHKLLVAHAERSHGLLGPDVALQLGEQRGGGPLHRPVVEQAQGGPLFAAQKNIRRRRQVLDQVQLLVDDRDAGRFGLAGAREGDLPGRRSATCLRNR